VPKPRLGGVTGGPQSLCSVENEPLGSSPRFCELAQRTQPFSPGVESVSCTYGSLVASSLESREARPCVRFSGSALPAPFASSLAMTLCNSTSRITSLRGRARPNPPCVNRVLHSRCMGSRAVNAAAALLERLRTGGLWMPPLIGIPRASYWWGAVLEFRLTRQPARSGWWPFVAEVTKVMTTPSTTFCTWR